MGTWHMWEKKKSPVALLGLFAWYNVKMRETPVSSFSKALIGFVVFISVSVGLTFLVNTYAPEQGPQQQAAAAEALMLKQTK